MKAQYRFRDSNGNVSVVSIWLDATYTPIDFTLVQSMGVLVANLSDAQLIGLTLTYTEQAEPTVAGLSSNVQRLYIVTCFLVSGDAYLLVIPSAQLEHLAIDSLGRVLPVVDPADPIMANVQLLVQGLTDEYGTAIDHAVLVGLAI